MSGAVSQSGRQAGRQAVYTVGNKLTQPSKHCFIMPSRERDCEGGLVKKGSSAWGRRGRERYINLHRFQRIYMC